MKKVINVNVVFLIIVWIFYSCNSSDENPSTNGENDLLKNDSLKVNKKTRNDSLAFDKVLRQDTILKTKNYFNDLDLVVDGFKNDFPVSTVEEVNHDLERLNSAWLRMSKPFEVKLSDSVERKMILARKILINYQKKAYPKYREIFAHSANDIALENDLEVDVVGNKNTCIRFIGYDLLFNKNKKMLFDKIEESLRKYRYARVVMTSHLGNDDALIWDLSHLSDTSDVY